MAYKPKLRALYRKREVIEEEIQKALRPIVFVQLIVVFEIPKTKEELSKLMKQVLNKDKLPWLDLRLVDILDNHVFIFGRESFILGNIEKIAKIMASGKGCKIGDVGITFSALIRFDLEDFI